MQTDVVQTTVHMANRLAHMSLSTTRRAVSLACPRRWFCAAVPSVAGKGAVPPPQWDVPQVLAWRKSRTAVADLQAEAATRRVVDAFMASGNAVRHDILQSMLQACGSQEAFEDVFTLAATCHSDGVLFATTCRAMLAARQAGDKAAARSVGSTASQPAEVAATALQVPSRRREWSNLPTVKLW